jgi:hypothetical protein
VHEFANFFESRCVHYERDDKSPLTTCFTAHTSAEALGPIRNQAIEPIATAPLSAVMTRSSQNILPILLLGVSEMAAASEFAGAIVSALTAVTMVAAGDDASLAGAPCALAARSISLLSSGKATRTVSPSITSLFAVTCGAPFEVLSLEKLASPSKFSARCQGLRRHCGVAHGVRDRGMPEEVLERPCVHSPGRQCVSRRMPQQRQPSSLASPFNHEGWPLVSDQFVKTIGCGADISDRGSVEPPSRRAPRREVSGCFVPQ